MLLRHTLPDGTWHYDWLIDRGDTGKLLTFRVRDRIDVPEITAFTCERTADHRRDYLDYQGPVSGGRGEVERLAEGVVERLSESPSQVIVTVNFDGQCRTWTATATCQSSWQFVVAK